MPSPGQFRKKQREQATLGSRTGNLFALRGKVKRNPKTYSHDVYRQIQHWKSLLKLLKLSSTASATKIRTKELQSVIEFLSHIVHRYPNNYLCKQFPNDLMTILDEYIQNINTFLRKTIIKNLCIMESNKFCDTIMLLKLFFKLLSTSDKQFRYLLFSSIIGIISRINKKHKNQRLNSNLQKYMIERLRNEDDDMDKNRSDSITSSGTGVKKTLSILCELYRKNVWRNDKIINTIANICLFHSYTPVKRTALHFMLGHKINEIKSEEELKQMSKLKLSSYLNTIKFNTKRSKKKQIKLLKIQEKLEAKKLSNESDFNDNNTMDMSCIRSVYNPQKFTMKLYNYIINNSNKLSYDLKLLYIDLISRLVSCHKLILYPFYNYMLKYIKHYQKNITKILSCVAQSIHRLVPPEILEPLVKHIINEFIGQFSDKEAIAVGINSIRLIASRQPLVMSVNDNMIDMLKYLTEFTKYKKDKGVQMAARGLISLYRIENPSILANKDRGKYAHLITHVKEFGEQEIMTDVPGAQLLLEEERILKEVENKRNNKLNKRSKKKNKIVDDFLKDSDDDNDDCMDIDDDDNDNDNSDNNNNNNSNNNSDINMKESSVIEDTRPLMHRRILTDSELSRLKELRVKNLMRLWGRKRSQVGLKEDRGDVEENIILPNEIESITTIRLRNKEKRKQSAIDNKLKERTFNSSIRRGGGSTNKEKQRQKPFKMTQHAKRVISKSKRSNKLKRAIKANHANNIKKNNRRKKTVRRRRL